MAVKIRGLNGNTADLWLLGGGSLLVWAVFAALSGSGLSAGGALTKVFVYFAFLEIFVNLPHFFISYRLAYGQDRSFVLRNPVQLILVPALLLLAFGLSTALAFDWRPVRPLQNFFREGLYFAGMTGTNSGLLLLAFMLIAQYSAVAWHYSKQAFGVTLFRLQAIGQPLGPVEVSILKYSMLSVWLAYFTLVAGGNQVYNFGAISYRSLGLPTYFYTGVVALIPVSLIVNFWLLLKTARRSRQRIDLASCGSVFSLYCWFAPPLYLRVPAFFSTVSPLSHSLQYLSFAARYEWNMQRQGTAAKNAAVVASVYALTVLAGVIIYRQVPAVLDNIFPLDTAGFFAAHAYVFLNLHHYAIDNVIWRRANPEVRDRLSVA